MYCEVVGGLSISANPNTHAHAPQTPKIGDLKIPSLNYGQAAVDGATIWNDKRSGVMEVANAAKLAMDSY